MRTIRKAPHSGRNRAKTAFLVVAAVLVAAAAIVLYEVYGIPASTGVSIGAYKPEAGKAEISYISVGQSNCTLIRAGEEVILIDAGDADARDTIENYLKKCCFREIEYIIVTHPHTDHIGSAADILQDFKVDEIIVGVIPDSLVPTNTTFQRFNKAVANSGARISYFGAGDSVELPTGRLDFYGPVSLDGCEDLNDCSLVFTYTLGDTVFMFTGDVKTGFEQRMVEKGGLPKADVLEVAHHGSKYSNSAEFLAAVDPRWAVISCGENNSYHYPHPSALTRLRDAGATVLRTDTDGTIVFTTDGSAVALSEG